MDSPPLIRGEPVAAPLPARGYGLSDLYLRVVAAAREEAGRRWEPALLRRWPPPTSALVVDALPQREPGRRSGIGRRAVVAYTDGDLRGAATRPLADVLARDGWELHLLGASMSCASLAAFAGPVHPDLVAVVTSRAENLLVAADAVAALRRLPCAPLVAVGGRAYHDDERLGRAVGAQLFLHADPEMFARALLERLA